MRHRMLKSEYAMLERLYECIFRLRMHIETIEDYAEDAEEKLAELMDEGKELTPRVMREVEVLMDMFRGEMERAVHLYVNDVCDAVGEHTPEPEPEPETSLGPEMGYITYTRPNARMAIDGEIVDLVNSGKVRFYDR